MKQSNSLDSFELYYEELEGKTVKTTPAKKKTNKPNVKVLDTVKGKFNEAVKAVRGRIDNTVAKFKKPRKKAKKLTKVEQKALREQRKSVILGIGLLLVVASIIYSTYVIFIGVDSGASRLALLPQALFATITLIKAFSKIYK